MSWRVQGDNGRWAEMISSTGLVGDPETLEEISEMQGDALMLTPTGPGYESTGDHDEVWLWLAAQKAIPGPARLVSGTAPKLPIPAPIAGVAY